MSNSRTPSKADRAFASSGARFYAKKYGLTAAEATGFVSHARRKEIEEHVEKWRQQNGFLAANSPPARGLLLSLLRGGR